MQRRASADSMIRDHVATSVAAAAIPIPIVDLLAVTAVQLSLLRRLGRLYGARVGIGAQGALAVGLPAGSGPILTDGGIRNGNSEFSQFGLDPFASPRGIAQPHLPNEVDELAISGGPAAGDPGFPAPEQTKAQPMPVPLPSTAISFVPSADEATELQYRAVSVMRAVQLVPAQHIVCNTVHACI